MKVEKSVKVHELVEDGAGDRWPTGLIHRFFKVKNEQRENWKNDIETKHCKDEQ